MTSRVAWTPPGSIASSLVTQKVLPLKTVLEVRVRPWPVSLRVFEDADGLLFSGERDAALRREAAEECGREDNFVVLRAIRVRYTTSEEKLHKGPAKLPGAQAEDRGRSCLPHR